VNEYFLNWRPAYPWSVSPIGLPALAVVAVLLVAFTIWTYTGHPNATRRRILIVLALRLAALVVALLTALRPSVGVQEDPKVPSVLIIGVDESETMKVPDELGGQKRLDAVHATLKKVQPLLDELATEQNVSVILYKFSTPDFNEASSKYSPEDIPDGKRSDYGTFLNKTFDRWQGERFIRGFLLIGDGVDNGQAFSSVAEAAKWGRRDVPINTFVVGREDSEPDAKDIIVKGVECEPSPAPIKTDVTVVATVNAYQFNGSRVVARVYFDGKQVAQEEVALEKVLDNKVRITAKAPAQKGEIKVKIEIGQEKDGKIEPLAGELSAENNYSETYLTVTKDGVRILLIDRLRPELMRLRDALRSEKRFDLNELNIQPDAPISAKQREFVDLDSQAYDVIILGNVTANDLLRIDAGILQKIADRVKKQGMGLMFLGGEHAYSGMPAELLPVIVRPGDIVENVDKATQRSVDLYQTVPTENGLAKMMKVAKEQTDSVSLWNALNEFRSRAKITGFNRMTRKETSTVYAWASNAAQPVPAGTAMPAGASPLLVGHQIGDGARGRVLAFAAYDTFLWERLGQPKTRQGTEIHTRFWKNCALWLAHQDEEEGQAYIRPAQRQLNVGGEQTLRLGVKTPGGADDPNAELTLKVVPLPDGKAEPDPAELDRARPETVVRDKDGAKVLYRPRVRGEYFAVLTSPKKDAEGKPIRGEDGKPELLRATAKFIAIPDTSDEMLRTNADPESMERLAVPTDGKALRLEDLPSFLRDLKSEPLASAKPKPRYYPDWRRNHSKGFLPLWLVVFTLLLGTEWGLRRLWGMV
jgi:hypothetical protein